MSKYSIRYLTTVKNKCIITIRKRDVITMPKTCCIFAAGDYFGDGRYAKNADLVIAADAGCLHAKRVGVKPTLYLGDFDSLGYVPDENNVIRSKPEKDDTDAALAMAKATEYGCNRIIICGALGGKRLAHTIANIQNAAGFAKQGIRVFLTDGITNIEIFGSGSLDFSAESSGYISVFSLSEKSEGVTLKGFKYELDNAVLKSTVALGVSNEFLGKPSTVSVSDGILAVIWRENG